MKKKIPKFYAVKHGLKSNVIFRSWDETKAITDHVPGSEFKSFLTLENAKLYLAGKPTSEQLETAAKEVRHWTVDKQAAYKVALANFGE